MEDKKPFVMIEVQALLDNFADYLYQYEFSGTDLFYTAYPYDLIDKDLDFDEVYYGKMMDKFDKMLEKEAKAHAVRSGEPVSLVKIKMESRTKSDMEYRITYSKMEENLIKREVITYEHA